MTKIESLERSLEMWAWLRNQARDGKYFNKKTWFEKTKNREVRYRCYLCQYAEEASGGRFSCVQCPVKQWREEAGADKIFHPLSFCPCADFRSPYFMWKKGIENKDPRNVLEGTIKMVELLENELKSLKELEDRSEKDD